MAVGSGEKNCSHFGQICLFKAAKCKIIWHENYEKFETPYQCVLVASCLMVIIICWKKRKHLSPEKNENEVKNPAVFWGCLESWAHRTSCHFLFYFLKVFLCIFFVCESVCVCVCARVCMCVIVVRFVKLISTCNCFSSTCFQNHSENGRRGRGRRKQVCPKAGFMVAWLRLSFQSNSEFNTNTYKVISPPVFNCIFNKSNKKKDQKETFHHKNGSENQGPRWSQNEQFH